jgi:hypothetical protein
MLIGRDASLDYTKKSQKPKTFLQREVNAV